MENIKTFSEGISTSDNFAGTIGDYVPKYKEPKLKPTKPGMCFAPTQKDIAVLRRMMPPKHPSMSRYKLLSKPVQNALGILKAVEDKKFAFLYPSTEKPVFITKELFRKSQRKIVENMKFVDPNDLKNVKGLLSVRYPVGKVTANTAKLVAERAARGTLKKEGAEITAKSIAKYTKKFLPRIKKLGVVAFVIWLAGYGLGYWSEPQGENYHRDVGWY